MTTYNHIPKSSFEQYGRTYITCETINELSTFLNLEELQPIQKIRVESMRYIFGEFDYSLCLYSGYIDTYAEIKFISSSDNKTVIRFPIDLVKKYVSISDRAVDMETEYMYFKHQTNAQLAQTKLQMYKWDKDRFPTKTITNSKKYNYLLDEVGINEIVNYLKTL